MPVSTHPTNTASRVISLRSVYFYFVAFGESVNCIFNSNSDGLHHAAVALSHIYIFYKRLDMASNDVTKQLTLTDCKKFYIFRTFAFLLLCLPLLPMITCDVRVCRGHARCLLIVRGFPLVGCTACAAHTCESYLPLVTIQDTSGLRSFPVTRFSSRNIIVCLSQIDRKFLLTV